MSGERAQGPTPTKDTGIQLGEAVVLRREGLSELITALREKGFEVKGPVVRDGAIIIAPITSVDDFPVGVRDEQAPGTYRTHDVGDAKLFAWAVGPASWKAEYFPARQELWQAQPEDGSFTIQEPIRVKRPLAIFGARPCDVAARAVLDRVLMDWAYQDPRYADRREKNFVVVVECGHPSATCFCTSMRTGPDIDAGFDLALTEIDDSMGHRFVVRVGSREGAKILLEVSHEAASDHDLDARDAILSHAKTAMDRSLHTEGLRERLASSIESTHWASVAERCLACGNCTLVCPTCFCSDVRDTTDITGTVHRTRIWSSCFDLEHSQVHGGAVRSSRSSRYRQWMTHKLSTWWDQFDTSGCVGCGRCIAWCPAGIDFTDEANFFEDATSRGSVK